MDDEKEKAFAHFDTLKVGLGELHAHAAAIGDAGLTAALNDHHAASHLAWTDYLVARGWEVQAFAANRSGGEDKPPKPTAPGS